MAELDPDVPIDYQLVDPPGTFDVIVGFEYTVRVTVDEDEVNRGRGDDMKIVASEKAMESYPQQDGECTAGPVLIDVRRVRA